LGPIPNPQSPIPQSPFECFLVLKIYLNKKNYLI